jgi:hypothetical protein
MTGLLLRSYINRKVARLGTSVVSLKPYIVSYVPPVRADTFNLGIFGKTPEAALGEAAQGSTVLTRLRPFLLNGIPPIILSTRSLSLVPLLAETIR